MAKKMNAQRASIITDRCVPPQGLGCSPSTLKAVIWCLRGLGAPGDSLSVPSEVIERRTCLGKRTVQAAIKVLIDHGILEQLRRPSPGATAEYMLHYLELAKWLEPADRDWMMSDPDAADMRSSRTRSCASAAHDRVQQMHTMDPTSAAAAPSCASAALTSASAAHDYKEVTALPAKPAAAAARAETAKTRTRVEAEQQLVNLAAAAAGILGLEAWGGLARKAGLTGGLESQCPRLLVERGVQDAETGLRAMERLRERLKRVDSPTGFFLAQLEQPGGPDETGGSKARRERAEGKRRELAGAIDGWSPGHRAGIERATRQLLERDLGEDVARELMPMGQFARPIRTWDAMLDFICVRYDQLLEIGQRLASPQLVEVYA